MAKIGVLGAGAWGTALANVGARAGHAVVLWGRDAQVMERLDRDRENKRRLPGVSIEAGVRCGSDLHVAVGCQALLAAVPAQSFRAFANQLASSALPPAPLVICAKGLERGSHLFLTEIAREILPRWRAAVLSGPSFARDVACGLPTAVTLAAGDSALAEQLASLLSAPGFRLYRSTDVRGVEIGGAAKNVLAIACGAAAGRALGASAAAALIARGFAEIRRYAETFAARPETLMGLSGLGDVVLTCSSPQSRNFALGVRLGQGVPVAEAMKEALAEGAFTASALVETARARQVEMPIAEAVAAILEERISVAEAVDSLLSRPPKSEH
jgi:glycerol-3-phosphate dehydrogenase (NAD(P)+)